MTTRKLSQTIIGAAAGLILAGVFVCPAAPRTYPKVTNVSPYPSATNEFYLTATNMTVTNIGGTNVQVRVFMDDPPGGGGAPAGLPCPMVEVNVGTMIICHFANKLTNDVEGASIHWHGIELNNDSDGTAITQDSILPGQTYLYQFIVPRAGVFWYHSHMIPGTSTFNGMYGPFVVIDTNAETLLTSEDILPSTNYTFPLVLSDISFTNGVPGKVVNGTNYPINTLIQLCENNALGTNQNDQPFCGPAGVPGNIVLVNGYPPKLAGSFGAPTTSSTPLYTVANNSRVRLQFFDASISRDFYMSLHYPSSDTTGNTNLYRIGGQGGYLDNAVLDGGVQSGYNFLYNSGSIVIGAGMRADAMFYPSGANGSIIELVGNPLPAPWNLSGTTAPGDGLPNVTTNYPLAFFLITNTGATNNPLAAGSPIVAGTSFTNVSIKTLPTNALSSPPTPSEGITPVGTIITPQGNTIPAGNIIFENGLASNAVTNNGYTPAGPNMNGYAAVPLDGNTGDDSWVDVPHPPSALWARVGDVLQLAIINDVGGGLAVHPFHLHGFSMQPMYIYSANLLTNLYTFNYNEYLDTIEVYPGQAIIFRIHLTDRPNFADSATGGPFTYDVSGPTGGAVGRWLMHCHIFLHGTIGMISELVVVSNTLPRVEGPASGSDSAVLAGNPGTPWVATTNETWLHLTSTNQSGTGSTNVIFTYDANAGATRSGNVTVAGETVAVTQAGSTYVQAPGPLTSIVSNGLSNPEAVAVDTSGNVYINDFGHQAIEEWIRSINEVSPLVAGLTSPQGLAIDSLGNVYFIDNGVAKEWLASTHGVQTVVSGVSANSVAVDGGGNLYFAEPGANAIVKWTATTRTLSTLTTAGLSGPYGVAVDAAGNVYIASTGNNSVREWLAQNGSSIPLVTTGLSSPWAVSVDGAGDVYIADGSDNEIKKWSAVNHSVTILASASDPTGMTTDATGNLFIANFGHNTVDELPYAFVDPTPKSEPGAGGLDSLPPVIPTTEYLGAPFSPVSGASWLFLGGAPGGQLEFLLDPNGGSPRSSYITELGENITINQSGPTYNLGTASLLVGPAAGSNSVVLAVVPSIATWTAAPNASWLHLSAANQSGTGSTNVVFSFDSNTGATRSGTLTVAGQTLTVTQAGAPYVKAPGPFTALVSTGIVSPEGVAVDTSGNVYFSDTGNTAVKKWTAANNTVTTLFTNGLTSPQGVAVDAAGNVYVTDFNTASVKKWVAASNIVDTVFTQPSGRTEGVALDADGNIYVSDPGDGIIWEWLAATSELVDLVDGFPDPRGVAVDLAGNVYISDTSANTVQEWVLASSEIITLVNSGINLPWDVKVDGSGNLYIADGGDNAIKEWVAANHTLVTMDTGLDSPTGAAVDALGNVYVANFSANSVDEQPYAFVNPTAINELSPPGSGVLPVVLAPTENLRAPFVPTSSASWLTITGESGGVTDFSFTDNPVFLTRIGIITLLGEQIHVYQAGYVPPPVLMNARMISNNVFQFGFTNANQSATFTVLSTTNLTTPLIDWTVIGTAMSISPGVLQFTDTNATNSARFYVVRSP